ncbi:MAG: dihydrolipoyllysine-residue succinyltransferase [Verrucomicrobia bacterium]|nr:dihydrolipoyllysine-residue succinyltransferase [Verrucomicrobiota bacterium]
MKVEIKVPSLGESISEATISRIIKASGSGVKRDEEIVEIETEKVNQVLYAPQAGQLSLNIKVGDTVKIGQVIGTVDTEVQVAAAPAPQPTPVKPAEQPPAAAPSARKRAPDVIAEMKTPVPVASSAPAPAQPAPQPAGEGRKRMSSLRKTIAQKLVEVKNTTAMLTTFNEVDMTRILEIRAKEQEAFQARYGVKLGFMSFFIKAATAALKAYPDVRAYIEGDEIVSFPNYDIGVAVSTDKGLMVPVIRGCDKASFGEIEKQIVQYSKKAREGGISLDDLRGGCFTITNGGIFGSLLSTPILNPPQSGILGMHAIVKRPMAIDDKVVIRPMMYLAFSYDHRIIDGKEAVQFLVHMKENLEDPTRLLLDL